MMSYIYNKFPGNVNKGEKKTKTVNSRDFQDTLKEEKELNLVY